tara:strand:- start:783 stop:1856 length:1074 start_codon:yes stop_codon:yes gene_type:complete
VNEKTVAPDAATQIAGLVFAVLLIDHNGHIIQANQAAEELLGRSAHRLSNTNLLKTLRIDSERLQSSLLDRDAKVIARGIPVVTGGGSRLINITSSPVPGYVGWRVVTLSEVGQEEMGDVDAERIELRAPAVLAHEIKNPLSAIRGASQLLAKRASERDRPLATMIEGEVDRIASLIDRMQQLGSRNVVETGPCNLHAAIRNAMATVRAGRSDHCELLEEFDPSLPPVEADQGALEQVLINLLANACDASMNLEDAQIIVRTRFVSGLVFSAIRLGKATKLPIEITVSDRGAGLAPELKDHAFEPFVSGKKNGQGLGLALVRKLLRDMGGRIVYERDDRAGMTHFRINLSVAGEKRA